MKNYYKLLLAFCFAIPLFAQYKIDQLEMTYGPDLPDDGQKIVKIIGESNQKIYALALKGKSDFYIKTFTSKEMKPISSNKIELPTLKDKEVDFEEVYMLDQRVYVIGSVYDSKAKKYMLIGNEVSEKGILSPKSQILFEAEVEKKSRKGNFYYKVSPNGNALLVMHTSLFLKEDAVKYEIKLFDENLSQLFTTTDKVVFDDKKKDYEFWVSDFEVNYKEDVFVVISEGYRDSKAKEKVEKFEIHSFLASNKYQKQVTNIDVKGKEIINCSMISTNKNTIKLVGFYASVRDNGRSNKELKGVYNATYHLETGKIENVHFNEFDLATKTKLIGERRAKKGKDVPPLYQITHIIEKNDGGLIVLSEYQMVYLSSSQGIGPIALSNVSYIKNEIIVNSFKPDGTLEWSQVVPKEQRVIVTTVSLVLATSFQNGSFGVGVAMAIPLSHLGSGPEYIGAIPMYENGVLQILINDNPKNKGITDIEKISNLGNHNNAMPVLFQFDSKGNMTRKDPDEVIKKELVIRPGIYCRMASDEYLIYASRKKVDKLGRMFLN